MNCYMTQQQQQEHGMTLWKDRGMVKYGHILLRPCTPSLVAAIGLAARVAAAVPRVATVARGASARTLVCGACVTVCKSAWVGESPPDTKIGKEVGTNGG